MWTSLTTDGSYEGKEPSVSQLVFVMSDATGFGVSGSEPTNCSTFAYNCKH